MGWGGSEKNRNDVQSKVGVGRLIVGFALKEEHSRAFCQ